MFETVVKILDSAVVFKLCSRKPLGGFPQGIVDSTNVTLKLETGLRQADSDSDLTRCLKLSNTCNLSHSQFPSLEMEMIRVFSYLRVIDRKK